MSAWWADSAFHHQGHEGRQGKRSGPVVRQAKCPRGRRAGARKGARKRRETGADRVVPSLLGVLRVLGGQRLFLRTAAAALLAVALAGCAGSPAVRHYTLPEPAVQVGAPPPGARVVSVGPVRVPDEVDRPQLVLRLDAQRVERSDVHRWAEALPGGIARLLAAQIGAQRADLRVVLHDEQGAADAQWRVPLDIRRFDSTPGVGVSIEARWSLRTRDGAVPVQGQARLVEPVAGTDPAALVAAHGAALTELGRRIAASLPR